MPEQLLDEHSSKDVLRNDSSLTIHKLFKNYLFDLLNNDYHRFINHRVSDQLTYRKEY